MRRRKTGFKRCALYLDGKEHIRDILEWALAANMTLEQAKKHLLEYYKNVDPEIKFI